MLANICAIEFNCGRMNAMVENILQLSHGFGLIVGQMDYALMMMIILLLSLVFMKTQGILMENIIIMKKLLMTLEFLILMYFLRMQNGFGR